MIMFPKWPVNFRANLRLKIWFRNALSLECARKYLWRSFLSKCCTNMTFVANSYRVVQKLLTQKLFTNAKNFWQMRKTLYKNFRQRIWPISKNFLQILLWESELFQKLMVYLPLSEIVDVSSRKKPGNRKN